MRKFQHHLGFRCGRNQRRRTKGHGRRDPQQKIPMKSTEKAVDGVFIYVGILPQSDAFLDLGITDEEGWIITNEHMETAIPGIFAIGDVRPEASAPNHDCSR